MTAEAGLRVWLLELEKLRPALEALEARAHLLSDDERADGTMAEDRRAVRIALRLLFARAGLGALAAEPLARGATGKPQLAGSGLDFSVSHSGGHALIALCRGGPVGVDVEPLRTIRIGVPRRAQIAAAAAALTCLGRPAEGEPEEVALLRAWTRLEACAKARGSGIGTLLTDLGVLGAGARTASGEAAAESARQLAAAEGLAVVDLALPGNLVGALAGRRDMVSKGKTVSRLAVEDCAVVPPASRPASR